VYANLSTPLVLILILVPGYVLGKFLIRRFPPDPAHKQDLQKRLDAKRAARRDANATEKKRSNDDS